MPGPRFLARAAELFGVPVQGLQPGALAVRSSRQLPPVSRPLIGRDSEIADLVSRVLGGARLTTLLGPPGVGKSSLALEVGRRCETGFAHGACLVRLAEISDGAHVTRHIRIALGLAERPEPLEGLGQHLRDDELLLVLDNFEHVVSGAMQVAALMGAAPGLRVLATSREPLRLAAEACYPVPPLALPPVGGRPDLEVIGRSPSVLLFVERARRVRPTFELDTTNAEAIAGICVQCEGIPLGLELAAANVNLLAPAVLLDRVGRAHPLPISGPLDGPVRHRTMTVAVKWSTDALPAELGHLLRRLSIFDGSFDAEAAAGVGGPDSMEPSSLIDSLAMLVEKNLLCAQPEPTGTRFSMLMPIRQCVLSSLAEGDNGVDSARRAHARWYLSLTAGADERLIGRDQACCVSTLERERGNVETALSWALVHDPTAALTSAANLWRWWWIKGHVGPGRRWLDHALTAAPACGATTVRAMNAAAILARTQGDGDTVAAMLEASERLARAIDDGEGLALATLNRGVVALERNDEHAAAGFFGESLAIYQSLQHDHGVAHCLNWMGIAETRDRSRFAWAASHFQESVSLLQSRVGDLWGSAHPLTNLGWLAHLQQRANDAAAHYEESLAIFRELGDDRAAAHTLTNLGRLAVANDRRHAAAYFLEALLAFRRVGEWQAVAEVLGQASRLADQRHQWTAMVALLGCADGLRAICGAVPLPGDIADRERALARARSRIGNAAVSGGLLAGRNLPVDDAVLLIS